MPTKIDLMRDFHGRPLPANSERFGRPVYQWKVPCDRCNGSGSEPVTSAIGGRCIKCQGDPDIGQQKYIPLWSDQELGLECSAQRLSILLRSEEERQRERETLLQRIFAKQIEAAKSRDAASRKVLAGILSTIIKTGQITEKQFAAVMMIGSENPRSTYIGTSGAVMEMSLHCTERFFVQTIFGPAYRHIFLDEQARVVVYFGPKPQCNVGDLILLKAKIKGHQTYRGQRQTTIERPTWLGVWRQISGTEDWDWCPDRAIFDQPSGAKQYRTSDGRLWDL
ncbi:MAG: hypothetical protein ACK5XN_21820 [Bacteroidota bacterium]